MILEEEPHVTEARTSPVRGRAIRQHVVKPILSVECVKDKQNLIEGQTYYFCHITLWLHFGDEGRRKIVDEITILEENSDVLDTKTEDWLNKKQSDLVSLLLSNNYACASGCE